ncbi:MAG: hypothetical protein HY268_00835 [Deltaproteobacteria bacterium]|nr:hypothetical protein [Deltaproteobacteria bacterium]
MRVLVIPEDFRKDQYVLKPIISAMMRELGKPQAEIRICMEPLLGGIDQALRWERIQEILGRYQGMVDLFLLCVDRDGKAERRIALDRLEQQAKDALAEGRLFLAENAWQEIEVWVLAGHDLPAAWIWKTIRTEVHPKEVYFLPFAKNRGLLDQPGEGRKTLAHEAARRYVRIRELCPEDIAVLEDRVRNWMGGIR